MSRILEGSLFSIAEVAKFLNVSKRTVQRMIKGGKLEAFDVGGQRRISPLSLERMLRGNKPEDLLATKSTEFDLF
jgi:excisionase family DNA binding protein|tara:strand:- start:458 stop:682 length:225 start_codon:yes stop_codon:yes gene_type:complete